MADLGSDIAGVFDLSPTLATVSGRACLAEALMRRLSSAPGSLFGNPRYGYDLTALIGSTTPPSVIEQNVEAQCSEDERVNEVRATVGFNAPTSTLTVSIDLVDGKGPFTLTLRASELTFEAFLDGVLFASKPN